MSKTLKKNIEKLRFFNDFGRQEGPESMPRWLFGGLVVVLTVILQVSGAMLWSTGLPKANIIPSWVHLEPILGLCCGHLGAKLGPRWVFLGPSGAMWRHSGALREAPGRHLEAKARLVSIDLKLTRAKKATCQNLQKPLGKTMFFGGRKDKIGRAHV